MGEDIKLHKDKPVLKVSFEEFYMNYDSVAEIVATQEWDDIYSHYYEFDKYELAIKKETEEEIENYNADQQTKEIIRCSNSFAYFCHKYVKILHPIHGPIPFILYSYQRRVIKDFESNKFNIISKFRQGGLTTVAVLWGLWRCLFRTGQLVMTVSRTDREAITAGEIAKTALDYLPSWLKPKLDKNSSHVKFFEETTSKLMFYSPEAARGKTMTLLIIDEAAFIPDMETHWKSMYPVINMGGACAVISTVNGLGNWYEKKYHEAESPDSPFHIIDIDYWEHPYYNDPKWVEDTKANLGENGWKQEVERSFLGSGDTFIKTEVLLELEKFTRDNSPNRVKFAKYANEHDQKKNDWEKGALWVWKEPLDGHEYIVSADCASGNGGLTDNNCIQILDIGTLEQVAEFYSNTVQPNIFSQIVHQLGCYYNTALIVVENTGEGIAVLNNLRYDLAYENLYYNNEKTDQPGIKPDRISRPLILESLQHRISNGSARINSRRLVAELNTFVHNHQHKKVEARKGNHDDAVMAFGMALYVRECQNRLSPVGSDITRDFLKAINSEIMEEIKREILEDSPEVWLSYDKEDMGFSPFASDEESPAFIIKSRKADKLLKEFGW